MAARSLFRCLERFRSLFWSGECERRAPERLESVEISSVLAEVAVPSCATLQSLLLQGPCCSLSFPI